MINIENDQRDEALEQWLFTSTETNKGLMTLAEEKANPELANKTWEVQEWLTLTENWANYYEGSTPERLDTWFEISWKTGVIAIEKDEEKARAKFKEIAERLEKEGWKIDKNAGRA